MRTCRNIAQPCRAISSQLRHIDNRKKPVKQQYLLHMSSQHDGLQPTNGWDRLASLGRPSKFQRVWRLGSVTALTSLNGGEPNFARCLAISWAGTLYIHFRGLLPPNGSLPSAKFTCPLSLAFSCIGSVIARHSSVVSSHDRAAIPFDTGCVGLSSLYFYIVSVIVLAYLAAPVRSFSSVVFAVIATDVFSIAVTTDVGEVN